MFIYKNRSDYDNIFIFSYPPTMNLVCIFTSRILKINTVYSLWELYPEIAQKLNELNSKFLLDSFKKVDNFCLGSGRSVPPRCIRPVAEVPYLGNNMVSFLNTRDSVHGVSARSITPFTRRYITFNAVLTRPLFHYKRKRSMKGFAGRLTRLLGR